MEQITSDDYLEKLPAMPSLSTLASEGSLDDINSMRNLNEVLKKELERMTEQYRLTKKVADQQKEKDAEITSLRALVEKITQERDEMKTKLKTLIDSQNPFKPVSNPLQTALINSLMDKGFVRTKEVEHIMRSIDRGDFSPKEPYVDRPQQLGFNTTISAPHMHAIQLEILHDCFGDAKKVIDIGTGSGFVALSLAKMMKGNEFKVYAVDHVPKLLEQAKENVAKNHRHYIDNDQIEFVLADGREGLPDYAPYDIMFIGGSMGDVPQEMIDQLAPGGSLVIPIGEFFQQFTVIHKTKSGKIEKNAIMSVMFGRLQSIEEQCPDIDE